MAWDFFGVNFWSSDLFWVLIFTPITVQVIIFMWTYPSYPYFAFLDERAINTVGDSLVFHPRCGLSVSLFNGFRSAHRPRYVSFQFSIIYQEIGFSLRIIVAGEGCNITGEYFERGSMSE